MHHNFESKQAGSDPDPAAKDEDSQTQELCSDRDDCSAYMRTGLCPFGHGCRLNHPPRHYAAGKGTAMPVGDEYPERPGEPICSFYLRTGVCKFGATCRFHHPKNAGGSMVYATNSVNPTLESITNLPLNFDGLPLRPGEEDCARYTKMGFCQYGRTCKFHHPQPAVPPPKVPVLKQEAWSFTPVEMASIHSLSNLSSFSYSSKEQEFPQRPGVPDCSFYIRTGHCKFGASCRYHHPPVRPSSSCFLDPRGKEVVQNESGKKGKKTQLSLPTSKVIDNLSNLQTALLMMKLNCLLFPHDYEFDRDQFVQLWMAGELIPNEFMEDAGHCWFDNALLHGELVLPSRMDFLTGKQMYKINNKMVECAVDEATLEMKSLYLKLEEGDLTSKSVDPYYLSIVGTGINEETFGMLTKFNQLRSLLFFHNCGPHIKQVPSDIFCAVRYLQALDMSRTDIIELPSSIGSLKELRYLDLSSTLIEWLPESLDCLCSLQTLRLNRCANLFTLPSRMKRLINLRHLEFDILGQLTFMPRGIGNLTKLRTLRAFIIDRENTCNIKELKNMNELRGEFCLSSLEHVHNADEAAGAALATKMYLKKLQLRWSNLQLPMSNNNKSYDVLECLSPHKNLEELQILCFSGSTLPIWIGDPSFERLVSIILFKCENCCFLPSLGRLPALKFLKLLEINKVRAMDRQFLGNSMTFPKLKTLEVEGMAQLISCNEVQFMAFPKLETLEIEGMAQLISCNEVQVDDFPCLRKLSIKHCPGLIALGSLPNSRSLRELEVSDCELLSSFPDQNVADSLETLMVENCPLLRIRCIKDSGKDWDKIAHVPNIWIDGDEIQCLEDANETI